MFGMKADGQLYARSAVVGKSMETPLGKLAGVAHRYRIDWNATSVVYWVDGAKVATHAVSLGDKTLLMRPVIADQGVGDGAVKVDWMRMTPYAATGTYVSQVFDAGVQVAWQTMWAVGEIPASAQVAVDVRTGDTATPDASWTVFRQVTPGDSIASFARYAQVPRAARDERPGIDAGHQGDRAGLREVIAPAEETSRPGSRLVPGRQQ